jgi:hypothetical protein
MNCSLENKIQNQVENSLSRILYLILYLVPRSVLLGWFNKPLERQPNPGGPERFSSVKGGVNLGTDPTRSTIFSYVECIGWGQFPNLLQQFKCNWPPRIGLKRFIKPTQKQKTKTGENQRHKRKGCTQ